ncbi:hypothetical protein [Brumicola pallidula]|uniref:Uncharacterized protein n=1 Tax=Brumicola pallidula DSM 14239 = ACAM 615 TaxID=1121922 RepID=K7A162_9ALTE|nr:hypothetical protein [Glaciecola pallidula]GAC29255.1 hypothetical protein GPAL_2394 [Glaciecola pallidula DSM 14239 = ACAM 615]
MSMKKTGLTTLFVAAIALTGSLQANELQVNKVLSNIVSQAMSTAKTEINQEVQKSILTSAYNLTFAKAVDPSTPATHVTITDIADTTANAKSTESIVTENSEDKSSD